MLPEPENVARAIKRIFRSAEERRDEVEKERDVKIRLGRSKIQRHIRNQMKMAAQLKELAKRAISINDEDRFRQVGHQLLSTQADIHRWEQYLISFDLLQARRDQAIAAVEMINSIKEISESMEEISESHNIAELQKDLEKGFARASTLDERMSVMMDLVNYTLATDLKGDESTLKELETKLTNEIVSEEAVDYSSEVESSLKTLREQLRNEK